MRHSPTTKDRMCLSCHFFRRTGRETGRWAHRQIRWMCSAVERQTIEQTGIWVACCRVAWLQLKQPSTLLSAQLFILVFWHSPISQFPRPDINVYRVYLFLQWQDEFLWLIEVTTGKANFLCILQEAISPVTSGVRRLLSRIQAVWCTS